MDDSYLGIGIWLVIIVVPFLIWIISQFIKDKQKKDSVAGWMGVIAIAIILILFWIIASHNDKGPIDYPLPDDVENCVGPVCL